MKIFGVLCMVLGFGASVLFFQNAARFGGAERFLERLDGMVLVFYAVALVLLGLYALLRKDNPEARRNRPATAAFVLGVSTLVLPGVFWVWMLAESSNCTGCRNLLMPALLGAVATIALFAGPALWLTRAARAPENAGEPSRKADSRTLLAILCVTLVLFFMSFVGVRILF